MASVFPIPLFLVLVVVVDYFVLVVFGMIMLTVARGVHPCQRREATFPSKQWRRQTLIKLVRQYTWSRRQGECRRHENGGANGVGSGEGCPLPSRLGCLGERCKLRAEPQSLAIFVDFTCYLVRSEAYKFKF